MLKKALAPSGVPVTTRHKKGFIFISIVKTAYNKAGLSEDEAQRVNDTPGLADLVDSFIASSRLSNRFANEEVASRYGYLSGYKPGVMDLDRQISEIQQLSEGIGGPNPDYLEKVKSGVIELPESAEKWGAVPNWKKHPEIFGTNYNEAFQKMLDLFEKSLKGKFCNNREGQLGQGYLRQTERSVNFWQELANEQGNPDILIVPIQFGKLHAGRSVRRAHDVFQINEFGLGALATVALLMTHSERLQHCDDLWIDCAGDEYSPKADGDFYEALYLYFLDGKVLLGANDVDRNSAYYGSVSGFLPDPLPQ